MKFLKVIGIGLICSLLVVGCGKEQSEEDSRENYLAYKSDLVKRDEFSNYEDLVCDIAVSLERVDDEIISYTTNISNPKENMNDVKVMVVHNYFTEDVFPTIGIFDENRDLLTASEDNITLVGYIDSNLDIKNLGLELKIWIEYMDDDGNIKDIYYKTTK